MKDRIARLGPSRLIDRVAASSPAVIVVTPRGSPADVTTVAAAIELARRGVTLLEAKRALEEMIERGQAHVGLPMLDDIAALRALRPLGIRATAAAS